MLSDIAFYNWHQLFIQTVAGANAAAVVFRVALPRLTLFPTFRVLCTRVTAGNVAVSLRFGFQDADADAAALGINFAAVAALNASDTRAPVWDIGAVAPNFVGNPLAFLPPRMSVLITSPAGTDLDYQLSFAGLGLG